MVHFDSSMLLCLWILLPRKECCFGNLVNYRIHALWNYSHIMIFTSVKVYSFLPFFFSYSFFIFKFEFLTVIMHITSSYVCLITHIKGSSLIFRTKASTPWMCSLEELKFHSIRQYAINHIFGKINGYGAL